MALNLKNLDEETRICMLLEFAWDEFNENTYFSPRLTDEGREKYPELMRTAIEEKDEVWLAAELRNQSLLKTQEPRRKKDGTVSYANVPVTAADTLAEGEFNRFYIRGVCWRVITGDKDEVIIYRAKEVENPRSESEALIGKRVSAKETMINARRIPGSEDAMGIPHGPNSTLSISIPE